MLRERMGGQELRADQGRGGRRETMVLKVGRGDRELQGIRAIRVREDLRESLVNQGRMVARAGRGVWGYQETRGSQGHGGDRDAQAGQDGQDGQVHKAHLVQQVIRAKWGRQVHKAHQDPRVHRVQRESRDCGAGLGQRERWGHQETRESQGCKVAPASLAARAAAEGVEGRGWRGRGDSRDCLECKACQERRESLG